MTRIPQVAIIGGNEKISTAEDIEIAKKVGQILIDLNCRIFNGGFGGVMEASCIGAKKSKNYRDGMIVAIIPDYNTNKANKLNDIVISTGMGFSRNQILISSCDLIIAIGGGAGTLNELTFAWQLVKKIFAFETSGWSKKLAGKFIDSRLKNPIIALKSISDFKKHLDVFLVEFNKL